MKKKLRSFRQDFKMPYLFREDLEKLEDIIKELSPRKYKFETEDFEYETIQEIPKDVNKVNDFHVEIFDPYISLNFNKNSAYIYSSDNEIKTVGVIKKMVDIVSKRERKFLWHLSTLAAWFASAFILASLCLMQLISLNKELAKSDIQILILVSVFMFLFGIIWWIIGYRTSLYHFSVIEFRYKKDKLNFFIKNKDQIIVGIIVAIITVLATLFVQKIFK